jgi:hypothetical protein
VVDSAEVAGSGTSAVFAQPRVTIQQTQTSNRPVQRNFIGFSPVASILADSGLDSGVRCHATNANRNNNGISNHEWTLIDTNIDDNDNGRVESTNKRLKRFRISESRFSRPILGARISPQLKAGHILLMPQSPPVAQQ